MSELPRARFIQFPLLLLAAAIATGIFLSHQFSQASWSILIFGSIVIISSTVLCGRLVRKRKSAAAPVVIISIFLFTGFILSLTEERGIAPNRISRMYEQGALRADEPVELTG